MGLGYTNLFRRVDADVNDALGPVICLLQIILNNNTNNSNNDTDNDSDNNRVQKRWKKKTEKENVLETKSSTSRN